MSRPEERGSATVLALVMACLLVTVAVAGAAGAGLLVGHRRAGAAADLAALAGASALQHVSAGVAGPCEQVAEVSASNRASVGSCLVEGEEVEVEVVVEVRGPFGASWPVEGRARAGPAGIVP